ncbi:serine hydrolase domain-containing protein, partial [Nostoc sp. NIES-2111]
MIALGHQGRLVSLQAFGQRVLAPSPATMTPDTVFDLASLTKVVATAPAVLRLVDEGRLDLDAPAARYWPDFGANGKAVITIRDLLTHFSGLRVGLDPRAGWDGEAGALAAIAAEKPVGPRGLRFSYSDEDFIVLGEIVRRVSGVPLDVYCSRILFGPLGMAATGFRPGPALRGRIAPSDNSASWLPQDPVARRMGGVAGHAGLFGTAADLARFARMILSGGELDGVRVLSERSVTLMTSVQSPADQDVLRGLGWDIRSPFSTDHTASFPDGSFGHTGYTGTSMWIDPPSGSFLIILANRLHPDGKGQVRSLRAGAAAAFVRAFSLP